jgi:hypothetical protein
MAKGKPEAEPNGPNSRFGGLRAMQSTGKPEFGRTRRLPGSRFRNLGPHGEGGNSRRVRLMAVERESCPIGDWSAATQTK